MKTIFKIGQRVKSNFRAKWQGKIIDVEKRKKTTPLVTVLVDTDQNGNPFRKNFEKRLDGAYLTILPKN